MASQWSNPKEIQIPLPYGILAAKAWGNENAEPVLALHGWQNNAGTFDRLIPLLTSELYIVAVDASGHGLSSHKPKVTSYYYAEYVVDIQRIAEYLKWESFNIIGHSMGGVIGLLCSSIFPEKVKSLVLLDVIKPASRETNELPDEMRKGVESFLKMEKRRFPNGVPAYSVEDAKFLLIDLSIERITEEAADILFKRGCKPSDFDKNVIFSRDIRVRMDQNLHRFSHDDMKAFMSRIQCHLLIVLGKESFVSKSLTSDIVVDEVIQLYKQNCKSFKIVSVEGNHFVHLNHPDRVAPCIDNFFKPKIA